MDDAFVTTGGGVGGGGLVGGGGTMTFLVDGTL